MFVGADGCMQRWSSKKILIWINLQMSKLVIENFYDDYYWVLPMWLKYDGLFIVHLVL